MSAKKESVDLERVAVALDGCSGPLGRPLTEAQRASILAACEGDAKAWELARATQVAPYMSLGLAVLKQGRDSSLILPPAPTILAALEAAVERNHRNPPVAVKNREESIA